MIVCAFGVLLNFNIMCDVLIVKNKDTENKITSKKYYKIKNPHHRE
jgi:hypothetical protein